VAIRDRAYVMKMGIAPQETMTPGGLAAGSRLSRPLVLTGVVVAAVIGCTIALWAHYGTAVFYEMIVAGIAACL
jgi:hypothetical protein